MKRVAAGVAAGVLLLAAAWYLSTRPDEATPRTETATGDPRAAPAVATGDAGDAPASAEATLSFQTTLLPDRGIGARIDSVRIGVARVSPDDAIVHRAQQLEAGEGAAPANLAELASVERWISVPAQSGDDGRVIVGPVQLPIADRYDLQARATDRLHFYATSFTPTTLPNSVSPVVAAGLRLRYEPIADREVRVLLRRVQDTGTTEPWQSLMQREAPALFEAFGEQTVAASAGQVIAPLPPGPVEVIVEVGGVEATRERLQLVAGEIAELAVDMIRQAVAAAISVELEVEFIVRGSGEPIEGLQVVWAADRGEQQRLSDRSGRVVFRDVDRQRTHRFTLQFPASDTELPMWPPFKPIEIALDQGDSETDARVFRRTIELAPLEWIVVRSGAIPIDAPPRRDNPYPIFVLQRERDGRWSDAAADHFLRVPEGMAVSLTERGTWRVMAALTPWTVLHSTSVDARAPGADGRYYADLVLDPGHPVELTVLRDGAPLPAAPVQLLGPARGLPPRTISTDRAGRLRLDAVTVPTLRMELPGFEQAVVDVGSASATLEVTPENAE